MRFLFLLLLPVFSSAQSLLVNGGFEEENICSEYKVNCAPEGWIYTVPSFIYYFKDRQLAHSGERFIALIAGHAKKPYYRTFVRSRLLCGLRKDHEYQLQFYVKSAHPILDSMGVYFSSYDFLFEKRPYKSISPSIYFANAVQKPAIDTNWQQLTLIYKATGDEAFITFGNFKRGDVTGPTNVERENNFFVLLDDISLMPLDVNEQLCADWQTAHDEIYAQDERHEYLDRLIKFYRNKLPEKIAISKTQVQRIDTLVMPDVLFATNSYALNEGAASLLDSFIHQTHNLLIDSVIVEGHTDSTGTLAFNQTLSQNRASSVAGYLQPHFDKSIQARGWASEKPVADNSTPDGRQRNRRVEIYFYGRD